MSVIDRTSGKGWTFEERNEISEFILTWVMFMEESGRMYFRAKKAFQDLIDFFVFLDNTSVLFIINFFFLKNKMILLFWKKSLKKLRTCLYSYHLWGTIFVCTTFLDLKILKGLTTLWKCLRKKMRALPPLYTTQGTLVFHIFIFQQSGAKNGNVYANLKKTGNDRFYLMLSTLFV